MRNFLNANFWAVALTGWDRESSAFIYSVLHRELLDYRNAWLVAAAYLAYNGPNLNFSYIDLTALESIEFLLIFISVVQETGIRLSVLNAETFVVV